MAHFAYTFYHRKRESILKNDMWNWQGRLALTSTWPKLCAMICALKVASVKAIWYEMTPVTASPPNTITIPNKITFLPPKTKYFYLKLLFSIFSSTNFLNRSSSAHSIIFRSLSAANFFIRAKFARVGNGVSDPRTLWNVMIENAQKFSVAGCRTVGALFEWSPSLSFFFLFPSSFFLLRFFFFFFYFFFSLSQNFISKTTPYPHGEYMESSVYSRCAHTIIQAA